jgi:hypothetical protein
MARMVRAENYPDGKFDLPPMPEVTSKLLGHYPQDRIKAFPGNKEEPIKILKRTPLIPPFKHLLRYDAESVFWYLFWCCIQAHPAGKFPEVDMPHEHWSNLTGENDLRDANFIKSFPKHFLHPAYRELEPLLESMSEQLQGDLSYATDEGRITDEYLHEVFQRLIINFLSANSTKDFMRTQKRKQPRRVYGNPMDRPSKSTTVLGKRQFQGDSDAKSVSAHDSWSKLSAHICLLIVS